MNVLFPPRTADELESLRKRNQERMERVAQQMGRGHLLHEANRLRRKSDG